MGLFVNKDEPVTASAKVVSRAVPATYGALRAITSSAHRIEPKTLASNSAPAFRAWQRDAWQGYEQVGEIHYGFNQVANILSRVRVYAAVVHGQDEVPLEAREALAKDKNKISSEAVNKAVSLVGTLATSEFPSFLRSFAINMSVPAECYLVKMPTGRSDEFTWVIRSCDELRVQPDGTYEVTQMRGGTSITDKVILPASTFVARIWKSSGRFSLEPDSSLMALADPIAELLALSRLVRSTTRSRLNAGMLFVPDDILTASRSLPAEAGQPTIEDQGEQFIEDLIDSMVTPIAEEDSAASVVPLVVTGPRDSGEKIRHLTFQRQQSDEWLVNRMERALERILQGIDIPKEIITGLANVKYSNAVVIDESFYKANIEPLCLVLVDSLTEVFLKPELRAAGVSEKDLAKFCIWYDPSEIVTRPSRSQDASDGYDKMLLSGDAWRREHGFNESDKPSEQELAIMMLIKMGTLPEEVVTALLNVALPTVLGQQREQAIGGAPVPFPETATNILQLPTQQTQTGT